MASVSVIVPIYNAEKYLSRSLESLLNQTLIDIEIILINDGSTDNSLDICKQYARKDSRIVLINQPNQGVSIARNEGVRQAKSEYIAFMDPDDDIDCKIYETLYTDIIKYKVDLVLCNYSLISEMNQRNILLPYDEGLYDEKNIKSLLLDMVGPKYFGQSPVMGSIWRGIYKKSIILENNIIFPVDIRPMQDLIFNINYLLNIKEMYINHACLYHYYENPNSAVTGYKSNMWDNEQKVIKNISDILYKDALYSDAIERIANSCASGILACIANEMNPQNNIFYTRKIRNIKSFFNDSIVWSYISFTNSEQSSIKGKFILYLLKNKRTNSIYVLKLFQNFLNKIKKF